MKQSIFMQLIQEITVGRNIQNISKTKKKALSFDRYLLLILLSHIVF